MHHSAKPGNILLDQNNNIHIPDFGMCDVLVQTATLTDVMGTPLDVAPEAHAEERDASIDVC
jgi:serine/threonine protein kinase